MGHKKRTYQVKEEMTGDPPKPSPVLMHGNRVLPAGERIVFNKNTDHMRKVDHYRIRFDIKDFGSSKLRFVPDKADAMWVHQGAECPTSRCGMPAVIWVDEVAGDGEWIDVINMDLVPENFQFTLNFVAKTVINPTPADYVPLDPGGGNENNGSAGSGALFDYSTAAAIGAGAGLVAFLGARLLFTG